MSEIYCWTKPLVLILSYFTGLNFVIFKYECRTKEIFAFVSGKKMALRDKFTGL